MFGLSFGMKKTKVDNTTDVNKTETTNQSSDQGTTGSKSSDSVSQVDTTNAGSGTSNTTGTSAQQQSQQGQQQTTAHTSSLGHDVVAGLGGAITSLLSNVLSGSTGDRATVMRGVDSMGNFDVGSYVNGTLAQARASQGSHLGELIGSIFSRVGGTSGNNSAATLLEERAKNDAAANLAGVEAQARATGAQIQTGQLNATAAALANSGGAALIPALATALKGGETNTTQQDLSQQIQNVTGSTTGNTNTSEQSRQGVSSAASSIESLLQQVISHMTGATNTKGTEHTVGTNSEMGGGLSLGL